MHYGINERDLDGWLWIAGVDDINAAHSGGLRLITTDPKTRQGIVNAAALQWLKAEIAQREIDVLMLDPFSRLIQGNENSVEVADQLMESLVLLRDREQHRNRNRHARQKGGCWYRGRRRCRAPRFQRNHGQRAQRVRLVENSAGGGHTERGAQRRYHRRCRQLEKQPHSA